MAERFVYSPKVWVFIKNFNEEIIEVTEYCTGGEINRLLDQVSTAEIRLRNPNKIFTQPGKVAFHPQDPITIFMERSPGYPVQVFTGYLDKTPYLQLFPGVVTLKASCTLKKLLYNYFQLAQPYTLAFFHYCGWDIHEDGIMRPSQGTEGTTPSPTEKAVEKLEKEGKTPFTKTPPNMVPFETIPGSKASNDGSFSRMIAALLYFVADWRDEHIYVEAMPPSVPKLISALWKDFNQAGHEVEEEQLRQYWAAIIGTQSYGSGGGEGNGSAVGKSGNIKDTPSAVKAMSAIAERLKVPPAFVIATSLCETDFSQATIEKESGGAQGWFQFQFEGKAKYAPYPGGQEYTKAESMDTAIATEAFCKAAKVALQANNSLSQKGNWEKWAEAVQRPLAGSYSDRWGAKVTQAEQWLTQYASKSSGAEPTEPEATQPGHSKGVSGTGGLTKIGAIEKRAKEITAEHLEYAWGGGHTSAGSPSVGTDGNFGYDCSGAVAAALASAGYVPTGSSVGASGGFSSYLHNAGFAPGPGQGKPSVTIYYNPDHVWMSINGEYFSADHHGEGAGLHPGNNGFDPGQFTAMHLEPISLNEPYTGAPPPNRAGKQEEKEEAGKPAGSGSTNEIMSAAKASSFLFSEQKVSGSDMTKALMLGGQRALMNVQPVLTMVEQMCQASLRSFQSLPNGDFFAFYPDYFGEFGHREPYWFIYDIEILNGGVDLSDENLVTHTFGTGNPSWPASGEGTELRNELMAGVMTIFEAFQPGILKTDPESRKAPDPHPGVSAIDTQSAQAEAVKFLQRYGARIEKFSSPTVFSSIFESLMAYQRFLLSWSRQFESPFTFTFMPELFPGGKVAFPQHSIQMYVESVTHIWDLEDGFQTIANLIAPAVYRPNKKSEPPAENEDQLPPNMIEAMIEPQRGQVAKFPMPAPQVAQRPKKLKLKKPPNIIRSVEETKLEKAGIGTFK